MNTALHLSTVTPAAAAAIAVNAVNAMQPAPSWAEVLGHRSALVRFAQRKLHDPMLAEDVVHDVFEAVISGRAHFAGRSALRSWLTGILKHKIVDLVRQRAHYDSLEASNDDDDNAATPDIACPQPRPDEQAEQRQALKQVLARIDALPPGLRDAIHLRVLQDRDTDDVCHALQISEDNLFVRLHRARKQLLS
jgi:RNA polymerase sigma-70 factor (ECF subfamily)